MPDYNDDEVAKWQTQISTLSATQAELRQLLSDVAARPNFDPAKLEALEAKLAETQAELQAAKVELAEVKAKPAESSTEQKPPSEKTEAPAPPKQKTRKQQVATKLHEKDADAPKQREPRRKLERL